MRGCGTIEGKREEIGLLFERRRMDVLALSETKMKGTGEMEFGGVVGRVSGVTSGRGREGVALLLSPEVNDHVTEWRELGPRIMWVKVKFGREEWVFLSVYGPGSEKGEDERERFWNELNGCLESFGVKVNVVLLGDLNTRVGDIPLEGVVGNFDVPGRNEMGRACWSSVWKEG